MRLQKARFTFLLCGLCCFATQATLSQNIPQYGNANKLDVACWNVEWFGSTANGPSNEVLQFSNILNVLQASKIEVWALEEVSDTQVFKKLLDSLPHHNGFLASISQTQKTALVYDTLQFKMLSQKLIITNQYYDFSSGRYPFEVVLASKNSKDTFVFIVIHLKANVGTAIEKQESWQRRKNASKHLKTYIDQSRANDKVIVLGDFNDDTDTSIFIGNSTPFDTLLNDSINYQFLTKSLSVDKTSSTVGFSDMIDHQMVSNELFTLYNPSSCKVLRLDSYINNYSNTTSDHYPVFASYNVSVPSFVNNPTKPVLLLYPNPLGENEVLKFYDRNTIFWITDCVGKTYSPNLFIETAITRPKGIFLVHHVLNGIVYSQKLLVE